jgi:hypothetical protein
MCAAKRHVRFTPNSDRESGRAPMVMSALPPKADMCGANRHVCFGPKADSCRATNIAALFDQRVGALQKLFWNCEAYGLRSFEIDGQIELRGLLNRYVFRLLAL